MVARLFWKFDGQIVRERSVNWPLFNDGEAFYKMFSEGKRYDCPSAFIALQRLTGLCVEHSVCAI
jgi:hypothetical protein